MNKLIIGFAGKKGCGKTAAATHLCATRGFVRHSFAEPIKVMTFHFIKSFGLSDVDADQFIRFDKEVVIPKIGVSARHLMQTLGTEWGRDCVHPDVWVMACEDELMRSSAPLVVFDDVRFENEATLIRDLGGFIIHIERGTWSPVDAHLSESGLVDQPEDFMIFNDDSLAEFLGQVDAKVTWRLAK